MASEEKIPPAGESVNEVTFIKWAAQDGAAVKEGDPIAEVETDKANADLFASSSGVLKYSSSVKPGTVLKIGAIFATIDANAKPSASGAAPVGPAGSNGSAAPTASRPAANPPAASSSVVPPPPAAPTKAGNVEDLSPATRRAAVEGNIDVSKVSGTGPGGRVTKEDVVAVGSTPALTAITPAASPTAAASAPATQSVQAGAGMRRVPMSKIRKRIAETLVRAKNTTAMLTTFNEVDMSAIMKLRATYKESFEKKHGIGLGFMSFFVKACTIALKQYERVNGQLDGDDVLLFDHVHMGVAVSTERGLTVPVLKHADEMSFAKIESEIKRVAMAARDGKLGIDELSGGTFTITNGGIFGSLNSTPIVNPPQSAILGMHAIVERPVAIAGKVEIRPIMNLALSYDHRIIDGKESVTFLVRVKQLLEDPTRLMLDV
jgi:2-oxoglutarate dehydrogenase E2 component (dihydrolipoamide succinyltransferase)